MKIVIDRFEGPFAVCEKADRTFMDIRIDLLPHGVKEGDVLDMQGDKISIDIKETEKRRKKIEEITKNLWN